MKHAQGERQRAMAVQVKLASGHRLLMTSRATGKCLEIYHQDRVGYSTQRRRVRKVDVILPQNGRRRLTRKPTLFLLSPCWCRQRGSRVRLCYRESNIAALSKRIQVLDPAQKRGLRGVCGCLCFSSAPPQRVHRVLERSGSHVWSTNSGDGGRARGARVLR